MYSNEQSLTVTWSDRDVQALLKGSEGTEDNAKLVKAAKEAAAMIDGYLRRGGYLLPLVYDMYGTDEPINGELDSIIQGASDCLTAYNLAKSSDLMKQSYEKCRADTLAMLENIAKGTMPLDLPKAETPLNVIVTARPKIFNTSLKPENELFTNRR